MADPVKPVSLYGAYCPRLMCCWLRWQVGGPGLMVLQVPEGHTPDMDGAVSIAQALLPAVNTIYVYAGDILDMTYWQVPNSKAWTALRPAYKPPPKEQ